MPRPIPERLAAQHVAAAAPGAVVIRQPPEIPFLEAAGGNLGMA